VGNVACSPELLVRLLHCFLARHICDLLLAVQITGLTPQMTGGLPPIAAGPTGTSVMQLTGGQQQQQPYQPQATGAPVYPGMVPHVTGAAYAGGSCCWGDARVPTINSCGHAAVSSDLLVNRHRQGWLGQGGVAAGHLLVVRDLVVQQCALPSQLRCL